MKKKNIAYILFGLAGNNFLSGIIMFFFFSFQYEVVGIPLLLRRVILGTFLIVAILPPFILVCVGLIILIKYRKEPESRRENL